jgi:N-glycosylase/DNA lyase
MKLSQKEKNMTLHEEIVQAYNNYLKEAETFDEKGVKAAAARARKALGDLGKLTKDRRKEIQDKKNEM